MTTPSAFTLFCDESGNTGADLFAESQPFSVTCFILLSSSQESSLQSFVGKLRSKHAELLGKELKFLKLGRTPKGLGMVRTIGEALQSVGGRLYFTINEKRYFACHILIETFLDVDLNPLVPKESEMPGWRRWLTNKVYDSVTDDWLKEFILASRRDELEALRSAGMSLVSKLGFHPDDRVVACTEPLKAGIENFFRYGRVEPGTPKLNERFNPASSEYGIELMAISNDLAIRGETARIVSDVEKQFGEGMDRALDLVKSPELDDEHYTYGLPGPCTQLLDRKEVSSHDSLGVQVADLGAGIISRVVGETVRRAPQDAQLMRAWEPFHALAQANPEGHWWRVSEDRLRLLLHPFRGACPPLDRI